MCDCTKFKLVILRFDGPTTTVRGARGLSLEEAQTACRNPQTSSRTANPNEPGYPGVNIRNLNRRNPLGWFIGYTRDH